MFVYKHIKRNLKCMKKNKLQVLSDNRRKNCLDFWIEAFLKILFRNKTQN